MERVLFVSVTAEATPAADAVRAQVERIVQSRIFRSAGVLRHLLTYLTERCVSGEGESLKEYSIGIDALGKPESFDPRQESVVRMHTARLRQKLDEYYRTEGPDDEILVDLPKGGFQLVFAFRPVAVLELQVPIASGQATGWTRREFGLASALAAVTALAGFQFFRRAKSGEGGELWSPELQELWNPLIGSNRRLIVCIATPLFVNVPGFGLIRDSSVNDWDNVEQSKGLNSVERALSAGMTQPSYDYTGVGTASGAFLLGQFLASQRSNVLITRANLLSWPEIAEDNVVFLGPATGIHQSEDLSAGAQLTLEPEGVRNLAPGLGETAFLADAPARNTEESSLSYALVSRIPAMHGHGAIFMLCGNQTGSVMGAVQAFTNPARARLLVAKLKGKTGRMPVYFQVVLSVKSFDDVPVDISYVMHRELGVR